MTNTKRNPKPAEQPVPITEGHIKAFTKLLAAGDAAEAAAAQLSKRNLIPMKRALEKLCCRTTKAYELINDGKIIAYRQGHQTLIDADSIERYHGSLPRIEPKRGKGAS